MIKNSEKCSLLNEESEEDNREDSIDMTKGGTRNINLHKGVANVMILWPEHATTCLQIAILTGTGLLVFIMLSILTAAGSTQYHKCALENVSGTPIIHSCILNEATKSELQFISNLPDIYPNKTVRIIILNKNKITNLKIKHNSKNYHLDNSVYENISDAHLNIEFIITDIKQFFQKSILHSSWKGLDNSGVLLACRALSVWNTGGTAIDINLYLNDTEENDSKITSGTNTESGITKNEDSLTLIKTKIIKRRSVGNNTLLTTNTTTKINVGSPNNSEFRSFKIYDIFKSFKTNFFYNDVNNNMSNNINVKHLPRSDNITKYSSFIIPEAQTEVAFLHGDDGALISTWQPCHAFTWEILFSAKLGYKSAIEIMQNALKTFCRGKSAGECHGLKLV